MSDTKLTDEEIIKTLECCADSENYQCNKCPLYANCEKTSIAKNALDLIKRQKAEIERLKNYELVVSTQDTLRSLGDCINNILKDKEEDDTKSYSQKAIENFATKIIAEIASAIQSNRDAINERIEKGHRDVGFESMCAGKILAMQGIRNFIEEEVYRMSNGDMRFVVSRVYGPNAKGWKRKVAQMSDKQVCALYYSFIQRGLIK